ncbi:hypothetical protein AVEN_151842-1 [Araneus ventricosus]|uniref:PiggyBac transposable element-derived protein domain-containing protein n=1 Tax=Araneus ventricosus TaxID=182803 RepID=A0A4Y2NDH2_ARAVE|nr:hypothetical protein AVEN_151842-1 [Araneus ventricosus]
MNKLETDPSFANDILWTDECTFSRTGVVYRQNTHVWSLQNLHVIRPNKHQVRWSVNTLTPKPPVTGHTTSILVGRISAGYCSLKGEKAVGRAVIKGTLKGEMRDERPPVGRIKGETGRTNPFHRSISKQTSVYNCNQILRTLSSQRFNVGCGI